MAPEVVRGGTQGHDIVSISIFLFLTMQGIPVETKLVFTGTSYPTITVVRVEEGIIQHHDTSVVGIMCTMHRLV